MRKLFYVLMILLLSFSCEDPSQSMLDGISNVCGFNGAWDESLELCVCSPYYEGEFCEDEVRAKFLGTFGGNRICPCHSPAISSNFTVNVTPGNHVSQFELEVVWGNGSYPPIDATLDEDNNVHLSEILISSNTYSGVFTDLGDGTFEWFVDDQLGCGCTYTYPR